MLRSKSFLVFVHTHTYIAVTLSYLLFSNSTRFVIEPVTYCFGTGMAPSKRQQYTPITYYSVVIESTLTSQWDCQRVFRFIIVVGAICKRAVNYKLHLFCFCRKIKYAYCRVQTCEICENPTQNTNKIFDLPNKIGSA